MTTVARPAGACSAACGRPMSSDQPAAGTRLKNAVAGTPPSVVPTWKPSPCADMRARRSSRTGLPTNFSGVEASRDDDAATVGDGRVPLRRQALRDQQILDLGGERSEREELHHLAVAPHRVLHREAVGAEAGGRQVEVADDRHLVAQARARLALDRQHRRQRRAEGQTRIEDLAAFEVRQDDGRAIFVRHREGEGVEALAARRRAATAPPTACAGSIRAAPCRARWHARARARSRPRWRD